MEKVIGNIQGKEITIETGQMARQANGAVVLRCGETVLLATATMAKEAREGADFFPLMVEFVEKYYAAGKFAGGYIKREARPSKNATLLSRLIDRPLRPCFPDGFFNEVQIIITMLSYDESFPLESLSILAASSALAVSDIPFNKYVGASLVGDVDGELVVNPDHEQMSQSTLDMIVAGTNDAVLMIESGANEISEERIIDAIGVGHDALKEGIRLQEALAQKVNKSKLEFVPPQKNTELADQITSFLGSKISDNLKNGNKQQTDDFLNQLKDDVVAEFVTEEADNLDEVVDLFGSIKKKANQSFNYSTKNSARWS